MIKLEKTDVVGFEAAIRGMRNPMNSWERSDSQYCKDYSMCYGCPLDDSDYSCDDYRTVTRNENPYIIGPKDHELMMKLAKAGPVHAKFRRMIVAYVDITAPLYWWKEFDTYKVGTVANSCSTMHKIHEKKFTLDDFSYEQLYIDGEMILSDIIDVLNDYRDLYLHSKEKFDWWQMIQLLPSSYNQKRTVMLNYEVLAGIYPSRKNHKLNEWHHFCNWIESLPYSEVITVNG